MKKILKIIIVAGILCELLFLGNKIWSPLISNSQILDIAAYILPLGGLFFITGRKEYKDAWIKTENFKSSFQKAGIIIFCALVAFGFQWIGLDPERKVNPSWMVIALALIHYFFLGIFEEGLFRLYILGELKDMKSEKAILISSILFGLAHGLSGFHEPLMRITQILYAFMIGILFAAVYLRKGNIWALILLHMTVDFLAELPIHFQTPGGGQGGDIDLLSSMIALMIVLPAFLKGLGEIRKLKASN